MKGKNLKVARLKHQLGRKEGVEVLQKLTPEERADAERLYDVQPWLYKVHIQLPHGFNIKTAKPIVKEMYYYRQHTGHFMRFMHLSTKQVHELREAGLSVVLEKYKIKTFQENKKVVKIKNQNQKAKQLAR